MSALNAPYAYGTRVTANGEVHSCAADGASDFEFIGPAKSDPDTSGRFRCPGGHAVVRLYTEVTLIDDDPEDELECPLCDHVVYVSPEDGDASLSEMVGHLRRNHHGENVNDLMKRVRLVEGGAR